MLERPAIEGNHNEVKVIIDEFHEMLPTAKCNPEVHAELLNTYWKLVEVNGNRVITPAGMKEAHLILASAESRAKGHSGCNNYFGQFESGEGALSFSPLGATRMACPEGMDTEQAFLQALGETTRYEISGLFLHLYHDDRLLARLEAVYH